MKRRTFIKQIGLLSLGTGFLHVSHTQNLNAATLKYDRIKRFGVITKRIGGKWLQDNPREGLQYISELGYRELEGIGDWGMPSKELKAFLSKLKLQPIAAGTSMGALRADDTSRLKKDIDFCKQWGMKYIVCYGPDKKMRTIEDWRTLAHELNKGGEVCKKNKISLLYHNHAGEFTAINGEMPFEAMMSILDPRFVNIELDLFWVAKAYVDPCEVLSKYPGRFPILHVKDMDKTEKRSFEDLGEGILDFPSMFALSKVAGVKHYLVEHDEPKNSEISLKRGANYLKNVKF